MIMVVLFGYKRFVNLAHIFQGFSFWNLKEVMQIQWWGAWVVSHWGFGFGGAPTREQDSNDDDDDGNVREKRQGDREIEELDAWRQSV